MKKKAPHLIKPSPSYHDTWMNAIDKYKYNLIVAHRESAKTTICTQLYLTYRLQQRFFNPRLPPILQAAVSSSQTQSKQKLHGIKEMIKNWDYLQPIYDARVEWAKEGFLLNDGSQTKTYSAGSEIRGEKSELLRFEVINCDDIIPEKPQYSNDFYIDWFYGAVVPAIDNTYGQIVVVGTIRAYDDILMRIWMNNKNFWKGNFPLVGNIEVIENEELEHAIQLGRDVPN